LILENWVQILILENFHVPLKKYQLYISEIIEGGANREAVSYISYGLRKVAMIQNERGQKEGKGGM
jgi:hypothetical protein